MTSAVSDPIRRQKLIAILIEIQNSGGRNGHTAFQAVERVLPAGCRGFQVDAKFLVEAFDKIGRKFIMWSGCATAVLLSPALCAAAPTEGGGEPVFSACAP